MSPLLVRYRIDILEGYSEAAKAGAQGYLEKPFDPDELIQLLRTSVRNV